MTPVANRTNEGLYDLVIRNGTLVTPDEVARADVAVDEGRIVATEPELEGVGREEIDAGGLHVLPGVVDAHVHFNEPGRAEWEGFETGTRALAAGGTTMFFDMPLNAHPPTVDAAAFDLKLEAAQAHRQAYAISYISSTSRQETPIFSPSPLVGEEAGG